MLKMPEIFSDVDSQKLEEVLQHCLKNQQSFGFAESCTSGLLSAAAGQIPGVSQFFKGAVISYSGEVKENLLRVKKSSMLCHGQVSTVVALEMARGAQKQLKVTWAVSVTGIAGPGGGSEDKPVGTVCFAVVGPGFEEAKTQHFKSANRLEIQLESVRFALQFFWDSIHA